MDSPDLQDESETADTAEIQIVAPSGTVLVTLPFSIRVPADTAMKTCLQHSGKEAKGVFVFMLGSTLIEEGWCSEKVGIAAGSTIEMTVLDCLLTYCEGHTFKRGLIARLASYTDGVRTAAPLPRDTSSCQLEREYGWLYGQDENSWCFGPGEVSARHGGEAICYGRFEWKANRRQCARAAET